MTTSREPKTAAAKHRRRVAVAAVALKDMHWKARQLQALMREAAGTARMLIAHLDCLPDGVPRGAEVALVAARMEAGNGALTPETLARLCDAIPMQRFDDLNKTTVHEATNKLRREYQR
jgi:hypothetical protein